MVQKPGAAHINLESFLAYYEFATYQINPIVFSLNGTLIIGFEAINFDTGVPLKHDDIFGRLKNLNLLSMKGYAYFDDSLSCILTTKSVPQLIFLMVDGFMTDMLGKRFASDEFSFVHNYLIVSNKVKDPPQYFRDVLGVERLEMDLININTGGTYDYYSESYMGLITNVNEELSIESKFAGYVLETAKLYIILYQIINADITEDYDKTLQNHLYIESLFYNIRSPIDTHRMLNNLRKTESFQQFNESAKLKLAYLSAENEKRRNKNSLLLNILLYFLTFIGSIGTLQLLESEFGIPFKITFFIAVGVFGLLGLVWGRSEMKQSRWK